MKGYNAYVMYHAMSLHFNPKVDYDALKYNMKTRATQESYTKTNLVWQFSSIENTYKHHMMFFFYLCFKETGFKFCSMKKVLWMKRQYPTFDSIQFHYDNFVDNINNQLSHIREFTVDELKSVDGLYPALYNKLSSGIICYETFVIANLHYVNVMSNENSIDPLRWPSEIKKYNLLKNFIVRIFDNK